MNYVKVCAASVLSIIILLFASYAFSQDNLLPPDDLISIPETPPLIEPGDIDPDPILPIDPCILSDLIISIDLSNTSKTAAQDGDNYYIQTVAHPFSISGEHSGFMKIKYNRIDVDNVNGTKGIQFVTTKDTFYFKDSNLTAFGERRNTVFGKYKGSGVIKKIINNNNNEIINANISYNFNFVDRQHREICFFIQE